MWRQQPSHCSITTAYIQQVGVEKSGQHHGGDGGDGKHDEGHRLGDIGAMPDDVASKGSDEDKEGNSVDGVHVVTLSEERDATQLADTHRTTVGAVQ